MASQGPNLVTAGASITGANTEWTTPGNITADDAATAECVLAFEATSNYLAGTGCGFTIPDGVTVDGIVLEVNDFTNTGIGSLALTKDGSTPAGAGQTTTGGAGWLSFGSPTDLWGTTWTAAEVNASTFGALLSEQANPAAETATVDAVRITVYYAALPIPATVAAKMPAVPSYR